MNVRIDWNNLPNHAQYVAADSNFSRPIEPDPNQLLTYRTVVQAILNGERVVRIDPHNIESSVEVKNFYIDVDKLDRKPDFDYFIKQATIMIEDIEVPKPVQDASEMKEGDTYFIPVLGKSSMFDVVVWTAKDYDMSNLTRGLVHRTRAGAVIHAMALIKVSGVGVWW